MIDGISSMILLIPHSGGADNLIEIIEQIQNESFVDMVTTSLIIEDVTSTVLRREGLWNVHIGLFQYRL